MKLSDYVASFLESIGCAHAFVFSGGASLHLIHSIENSNINMTCPLHEQAAAMAADAYYRATGRLAVAIATSGPGATNLLTGICSAYFDSVPAIYITGQVATFRMKKNMGVRQIGFQETDIVAMVHPVVNYAVTIKAASDIRYELEKAYYLALTGRSGPVLIDIPDNLQREDISPENLRRFDKPIAPKLSMLLPDEVILQIINLIKNAKRPVIIAGWGIHLSKAYVEVIRLIETLNFPVAPTWAMAHLLDHEHELLIGTFGTHGTRYGNFAVQNADLIIALGSRLDTKSTGSPPSTFARGARKIHVDIDETELNKFDHLNVTIDFKINSDIKIFAHHLLQKLQTIKKPDTRPWLNQIKKWKSKYPICPLHYYQEQEVNPYVFVKALSESCKLDDVIIADTGCTIAWMMQAFDFKKGQRLYHDFNNTAMGWGMPASIGVSLGLTGKRIISVMGDGSFSINVQELAVIVSKKLPIKIFVLDTHGHLMVQQTQSQWLESKYIATSTAGGLPHVDICNIAKGYGLYTMNISKNSELSHAISEMLDFDGPALCVIEINQKHRVIPQVKFGCPNEDLEPLLPREELAANMLI